jgi:hypothetical protein
MQKPSGSEERSALISVGMGACGAHIFDPGGLFPLILSQLDLALLFHTIHQAMVDEVVPTLVPAYKSRPSGDDVRKVVHSS